MRGRGLDWNQLTPLYQKHGIHTFVHQPCDDFSEREYPVQCFTAAQYLNDMISNKGHKVFMHCSSGISRCATVLLTYLCLFKRLRCWKNIV